MHFPCRLSGLLLAGSLVLACWLADSRSNLATAQELRRPNVLLIVTDDQGYGDLGIHGNTMIRTPSLDQLARQSVRLTNFHVDPTCAESRSALMTGKYSCRVGVWHTIMGRSILRRDEKIMPQYFAEAGYKTSMFGKWHLGDNYPYRPHDRGFHETLYHRGGGVGQSPDAWGNDYFDDTYFRNGKPEPQKGYCTDVWFREATKFIERHQDEPFFCYVATNAPHSPYNVDPKYAEPYLKLEVPQPMANFYGMIANIDENIGKLLAKLDELKLSENTIVVFMTDNGTAAGVAGGGGRGKGKKQGQAKAGSGGWKGFNADMRAQKGSQYDGGHRVPCFIRWPAKIKQTGDAQPAGSSLLCAHFCLLSTLLELCEIRLRPYPALDGHSLRRQLGIHVPGENNLGSPGPPVPIIVHSQRVDHPEKWRKCAVMHRIGLHDWRLVDGKELYDLRADPGQTKDIAAENPEVVRGLREFYDEWWADVSKRFDEYSDIPLGDAAAPKQELCCHDWHPGSDYVPWSQSGQQGVAADPLANGVWAVEVARDGEYVFTLRMRPEGTLYKLPPGKARVKIGDIEGAAEIPANADSITITLPLKKSGHLMLQTWLTQADGQSRGAYYVTVERK